MRAAMADAREGRSGPRGTAASRTSCRSGSSARAVEGRRLWHDPRRRKCSLASLTTFTYEDEQIVSVAYSEPAADLLPAIGKRSPRGRDASVARRRVASPLRSWPSGVARTARSSATTGGQTRYVAGSGAVTLVPADEPRPCAGVPRADCSAAATSSWRQPGATSSCSTSGARGARRAGTRRPTFKRSTRRWRDQGVQFVGVNIRDNDTDARAFEREFGVTYPSVVDTNGSLLLAFRDTLPPTSIPSTLVVDREGRMAARVLGQITETSLRDLVVRDRCGGSSGRGRERRDQRWVTRSATPCSRARCSPQCRSRPWRDSCRSCRRACCRWSPAICRTSPASPGRSCRPAARAVVLGALLFVLGFTVVFVSYGALFGGLGAALREHADPITRVSAS